MLCTVTYELKEVGDAVEFSLITTNVPVATRTEKSMAQGGKFIVETFKSVVENGKPSLGGRMMLGMMNMFAPFTPKVCKSENWSFEKSKSSKFKQEIAMAVSPDQQLKTMLANIPDKTGKTLAAWKKLIAKSGLEKHGEIIKHLKGEHGVTHGFANLISSKYRETDEVVDLVEAQYSAGKAGLRPVHDAIVKFAKSLGKDVEVAPKKASVSLRRKKQFALIVPATKTRIDLGLALKGEAEKGRLEKYNAMCSHRVRLETVKDFDKTVKAWMKEAYGRSG